MSSISQSDLSKMEAYRGVLKAIGEPGATLETVRTYVETQVTKIRGESFSGRIPRGFDPMTWLDEWFNDLFL